MQRMQIGFCRYSYGCCPCMPPDSRIRIAKTFQRVDQQFHFLVQVGPCNNGAATLIVTIYTFTVFMLILRIRADPSCTISWTEEYQLPSIWFTLGTPLKPAFEVTFGICRITCCIPALSFALAISYSFQ